MTEWFSSSLLLAEDAGLMLYFVKIEVVNLYPFQQAARSLIASEIIVDGTVDFMMFLEVAKGGDFV